MINQYIDESSRLTHVLEMCNTQGADILDLSSHGAGLPGSPFGDCHLLGASTKNFSSLPYPDNSIDTVICIDTLELLNPSDLVAACEEIGRIARNAVVVGVPYRQDIQIGRATCGRCGTINPPYGHRSVFDERRLRSLFSLDLKWDRTVYSGEYHWATNPVSVALLDFAGNPFGSYAQEEPCIGCGNRLQAPSDSRNLLQKFATRGAALLNQLQVKFVRSHAKYIDVLLRRSN